MNSILIPCSNNIVVKWYNINALQEQHGCITAHSVKGASARVDSQCGSDVVNMSTKQVRTVEPGLPRPHTMNADWLQLVCKVRVALLPSTGCTVCFTPFYYYCPKIIRITCLRKKTQTQSSVPAYKCTTIVTPAGSSFE